MESKTCTKCHQLFSSQYNYRWCETCRDTARQYMRKWYKNPHARIKVLQRTKRYRIENLEKVRAYDRGRERRIKTAANAFRWRLKKNKWNQEHFDKQFNKQKYKCANKYCTNAWTSFDHNHTTGEPRGMLCVKCNTALGSMREDEKIMRGLMIYLRKWS